MPEFRESSPTNPEKWNATHIRTDIAGDSRGGHGVRSAAVSRHRGGLDGNVTQDWVVGGQGTYFLHRKADSGMRTRNNTLYHRSYTHKYVRMYKTMLLYEIIYICCVRYFYGLHSYVLAYVRIFVRLSTKIRV